ncbi:MAG: KTSC domain-containing protein [Ginsengibacter sp.]
MPSSVISTISYKAHTATLRITFVSGKVYDYKKVPEEIYNALLSSKSKGTYFNEFIREFYQFEQTT